MLKIADEKIEEDLKIICDEILKKVKDVDSIILTGGFARGEGPVKIEKGKAFPYNDYDIQIISRNNLSKTEIDNLSNEISQQLGYKGIVNFYPFKKEEQKLKNNFYIDLKCDSPESLKKLLPRIRTIELKENSRVLYGEDKWNELKKLIPDYNLNDISLSEGAKLLLDRMSQMIEYYSVYKKYEKEFLTYIIQQAYAAICTSLLLLDKKYEIGYKKSMEIFKKNYKNDFPELYQKIPDLDKKIEQYISWKINPQKLPSENVEEEWFIAKDNLLEASKYFFSRFLNKKINNTDDLANAVLNMEKEFYSPYIKEMIRKKIKGLNVKKFGLSILIRFISIWFKSKYNKRLEKMNVKFKSKSNKSPDMIIFSSLIYLIDSISRENKIDSEELSKGKERLALVYPIKSENWEELSLDYANAYIAFFLQKF